MHCFAGHDDKYGGEVHKSLALANLAPQYLYEEAINFGRPTRYVIMELVGWRSLGDWLRGDAEIPAEVVISNLERAVNVLHESGHIHGDFRPSNILISKEGEIRIVDFDWSTKMFDERNYPERLNSNIIWPAKPGGILRESHDDWYFYASIKSQIREKVAEQQQQRQRITKYRSGVRTS